MRQELAALVLAEVAVLGGDAARVAVAGHSQVGLGRIAISETELPNFFVYLV
jgi:hypothetical protein